MSIEMLLATGNKNVARDILEGYTRTGGKNWSRIALSSGRDWTSKENAGLVAFFVNKYNLGAKTYVEEIGVTLIGRDAEIERQAIQNMDRYVTEESNDYGAIAFWSKAPHIHAWFDNWYFSFTDRHMRSYVKLESGVLRRLRDECAEVLDKDRKEGRDAAMPLMQEYFPLTGAPWEMFCSHTHTQKYFDDLEQTKIFLDHLFTLEGAKEAIYAYDPWF